MGDIVGGNNLGGEGKGTCCGSEYCSGRQLNRERWQQKDMSKNEMLQGGHIDGRHQN